MNKFNLNKSIIIALIIAIVAVAAISITNERKVQGGEITPAGMVVNDSVSLVDKIVGFPGRFINGIISNIHDLINTYEENQQLKSKLDNYDEAIIQTKNQQEEIDKLKKELKLNSTLTSFKRVAANVIARNPDTWQDILVVDKGKENGIKVNMAVMSGQGLIGRVIQVNNKTSKVELLTSSNQSSNHFPVRVMTSGESGFGLLKSYDENRQLFVISQLTGGKSIKQGDVVETSGLGGASPANLLVGTVEEIKQNETGLEREVYVKPATNTYDISVVTIIQRMVEDGTNE